MRIRIIGQYARLLYINPPPTNSGTVKNPIFKTVHIVQQIFKLLLEIFFKSLKVFQ